MQPQTTTGRLAKLPAYLQPQYLNVPENIQLPTQMSTRDKGTLLDLTRQCLRVTYNGSGKNDSEAGAVRSNYPIPISCGIYYYEVLIVSKGRDGYADVLDYQPRMFHFSGYPVSLRLLNPLPGSTCAGWERDSWGYHGDDGHSFHSTGSGKPFGPTFITNDTIGCGVNFRTNEIFFTKNGVFIGVAFTDPKISVTSIHPSVGLRTPGEQVELNFGQKPFKFDICNYVLDEKRKLSEQIEEMPLGKAGSAAAKVDEESVLSKLIVDYLLYHGYCNTAEVFSLADLALDDKSAAETSLELRLSEARNRSAIRQMILAGSIDRAMGMINQLYPDLLDNNADLLLQLRCRKFVEMISRDCLRDSEEANSEDHLMRDSDSTEDTGDAFQQALEYGQNLQDDYRDDERPEVQAKLVETFSLLAYPDPAKSVVGYMLNPSRREPVADAVNSAIVAFQNGRKESGLERICRQIHVTAEVLRENNSGSAAFLTLTNNS